MTATKTPAAPLTPALLATELSTDAKTLRRFLRDNAAAEGIETPGKGGRWEIKRAQVRSLKSRFNKWVAADEAAKAERKSKSADSAEISTKMSGSEIVAQIAEHLSDAPDMSDDPDFFGDDQPLADGNF